MVVEPRLSTQWFVRMDELSKNALENQKLKIKYTSIQNVLKTFVSWMENVHD